MKPDVPAELAAFLAAGKQLKYDATRCEAGLVRLHSGKALRVTTFEAQTYGTPIAGRDPHGAGSGTYAVDGVDLVKSCTGDYDPEGLLVWFPKEEQYGVVDTSHDYILLFGPDADWARIVADPVAYLNAQWAFEDLHRATTHYLEPWHRYPWRG